jgi:O-antigen ligase
MFAVACGLWWIAFQMSRSANSRGITPGFVALGLWMLLLIGALALGFHHYIVDFFFWASTTIFLLLITAVALTDKPAERPRTSLTPD